MNARPLHSIIGVIKPAERSCVRRIAAGLALSVLVAAIAAVSPVQATPVGSSFTFQGQLQKSGAPYTGTAQLLLRLYDSATGGTQIGGDDAVANVPVANGLFTAELDFGAPAFNGDARWIEIRVQTTGDGDYTLLTPRQKVTTVPYGLDAINGGTGGSQWVSDGPDLTYPGGSVGVTGASSPFAHGKGVFLEGGNSSFANVFAFNYDNLTPLTLYLNAPGGPVTVNTTTPVGEFTSRSSGNAAIAGIHSGAWIGVYGESQTYQGVFGKSTGGTGVAGEGGGAYNAGVAGFADNAQGWGGYFKNNAGGIALLADGLAQVRTLDITGGSDIVEGFKTGARPLSPGTVVVIDAAHPGELRACREPYDHRVAGVVSGAGGIAPGLHIGQKGVLDGDTPIAMSGRVYVRCSTENGPIRPGDLLTTSSTCGHAMRATDPARNQGSVVGKAMTALDHGTGLVLVLVNLQ